VWSDSGKLVPGEILPGISPDEVRFYCLEIPMGETAVIVFPIRTAFPNYRLFVERRALTRIAFESLLRAQGPLIRA
jgi:hypothetical protein